MIRPLTAITLLLACGSGLFLYQAKHRVQVLDRTIQQTIRTTDTLREQTRMLHAEWTLLNDPERLRRLSDQFLPELKTVAPNQFTSLADLNDRLPAPVAPTPPAESSPVPVAPGDPLVASATPADSGASGDASALPVPPAPPPAVAWTRVREAAVSRVVETAPPRIAARPAEPPPVPREAAQPASREVAPPVRLAVARPAERPAPIAAAAMREARPAAPELPMRRPIMPVVERTPPQAAPMQGTGSLLGMAHNYGPVQPSLPRPVPLNAASWSVGGGG